MSETTIPRVVHSVLGGRLVKFNSEHAITEEITAAIESYNELADKTRELAKNIQSFLDGSSGLIKSGELDLAAITKHRENGIQLCLFIGKSMCAADDVYKMINAASHEYETSISQQIIKRKDEIRYYLNKENENGNGVRISENSIAESIKNDERIRTLQRELETFKKQPKQVDSARHKLRIMAAEILSRAIAA
ncbi:hypothetical protein EGM51_04035 [Verrucomicrobia bacterium S94]|nr:hypothetical protein EGM51_04035 [Verrucomicrobia bacterium S94]